MSYTPEEEAEVEAAIAILKRMWPGIDEFRDREYPDCMTACDAMRVLIDEIHRLRRENEALEAVVRAARKIL